ncbi:MAG: ABC transporter ATP-binding protein [Saprospiraceae bacterium]|nr:ABC transporter ATP-binding protein [Saprospiraceae bacterium]
MIKVQNIHKQFKTNKVLRDISIDFGAPGITSVLGPNGSGKTTLLKCILGLIIPNKGDILFDGVSIKNKHLYRNQIGHLPQIARFPENLTPTQIIHMIKDLRGNNTSEDKYIEMFNLKGELHKKMNTLSGGNKQKVNLLLTLMYDTPIIILDEPSTGLDPVALLNLKKELIWQRNQGKQIIVTTHIMPLVEEIADRIVFLLDGKIYYDGSLESLISQRKSKNLEHAIASILQNKAPIEVELENNLKINYA